MRSAQSFGRFRKVIQKRKTLRRIQDMEQNELRRLLVEGETFTVEFKDGSVNDSELVKAVVCLANGSGGVLLVGVDNNGGIVRKKPNPKPAYPKKPSPETLLR